MVKSTGLDQAVEAAGQTRSHRAGPVLARDRLVGFRSLCATTALLLLFNAPALAQTVVDPQTAEFDPSVDHDTIAPGGEPLVARYDLAVYLLGGSQPELVVGLGKPSPDADGKVRVDVAGVLSSQLAPGVSYEAGVAAVGPGGSSWSEASNTFSLSGSCSYSITPASEAFDAGVGTGSVTVTADSVCAWTATSGQSWVTVNDTAGAGSGTVSYGVTANTSPNPRTATLTVAGQPFTVSQAAASCSYSVTPTSQAFDFKGGIGTITITTGSGCPWTATSGESWITVDVGAGSGVDVVSYQVLKNRSKAARAGTLTIAGQAVTVLQDRVGRGNKR